MERFQAFLGLFCKMLAKALRICCPFPKDHLGADPLSILYFDLSCRLSSPIKQEVTASLCA